ncbi:cytochrome P450 [Macrolepiota fuliginosa MF-IS2]|uniref:Cytochrome P450 n=1 Tax=Macrolepiota fuliginosa MF-IS2 TaxID=1400762 RepID=A0A9P6C239_9AGAR|nr:cytochrome P450 [Macrolepiota fuliginosa MF-IS2]
MIVVLLAEGLLLYTVSLIAWRVFSWITLKSPLDIVPGPPSHSWFFGNASKLFNPNGWDFHYDILKRYGGVIRLETAFGDRLLVISDPKALYSVLIKDPYVYEISSTHMARRRLLMGDGLLSTLGEKHRKQRKLLNPVFSINHMRGMIPLFYEVTERLQAVLKKKLVNGPQEIDILHWMTRTALELIGRSGMDYSFDSLLDDGDVHPYSVSVKRLSQLLGGPVGFSSGKYILPFAQKFNFPRLKRYIVEHIPSERVQGLKEITDIMYRTSVEIIESKKQAMASSNPEVVAEMTKKKDIINILLRANMDASKEDRLTDEEVVGQISTFVFAGMDTTSSGVSRILQLLATHEDVQEKLREEIREAQKLSDGQLSYDQLVSLPYLDAVCRESLRVYPPINLGAMRTARQDMILPLSKPVLGSAGKEVSEIYIPKGTDIVVSTLGSNCNSDLWGPDSYEWKPERWLAPLPKAVESARIPGIYSHLMSFSGGGRSCIGFKFSQLEMKVVLSVLISSFKFSKSEKEISWRMNNIAGPVVTGEEERHPQLPVVMSLVD